MIEEKYIYKKNFGAKFTINAFKYYEGLRG